VRYVMGTSGDREPSAQLTDGALAGEVTRKARCADGTLDPDEWFPVSTDAEAARHEAADAIAICMACPVRGACLELSLRRWTIGQYGVWGGLVAADRAALRRRWLASPHEYGRALPILDRIWDGSPATNHAGRGGRPATAATATSRHAESSIRAVRMARALLRHLTAAVPRPEGIDARRPGRWLTADSARAWPIHADTMVRRRAVSRSRRAARSGGNRGERDTRSSA
jgi:Transcription factor WhiB